MSTLLTSRLGFGLSGTTLSSFWVCSTKRFILSSWISFCIFSKYALYCALGFAILESFGCCMGYEGLSLSDVAFFKRGVFAAVVEEAAAVVLAAALVFVEYGVSDGLEEGGLDWGWAPGLRTSGAFPAFDYGPGGLLARRLLGPLTSCFVEEELVATGLRRDYLASLSVLDAKP